MSCAHNLTSAGSIPVLCHADALVVEGTLAGCIAAHTLAGGGLRTALAASACSLPYEMSVCRRPWVSEADIERLPGPFRKAFRESISRRTSAGEPLLNLAGLAVLLEDLLLDAGVLLFYGMTPCGIARASDRSLSGVVFGGKFGLQAITAGRIVDCTPTAVIPALAGHRPTRRAGNDNRVTVGIAAKVGMASDDKPIIGDRGQENASPTVWPEESVLSVPEAPALEGGQVALHGPYAEFILRLPVDTSDPFWYSRLSNSVRKRLVEIGACITTRRIAEGKRPLYFHRFSGGLLLGPIMRTRAAVASEPYRPCGLDNVWVCGSTADVDNEEALRLADPYGGAEFARRVAEKAILERTVPGPAQDVALTAVHSSAAAEPSEMLCFSDTPPLHGNGDRMTLGGVLLPTLATCDVLVVGGGTSGVPAALAAAQSGARTILVEQLADVGGVRSTGGVASYWFGRETPYLRACDDAYDRCSDRSGMAEEAAMLHSLVEAGVNVLTHCPTVGVVREGDRVVGAIVVTGCGLGIVRGSVTVDATGDADLAAWAGAPYEYGNGRDAWTMWASFANFNEERRAASRQYESAIQVDDPWDFTRTILRGRRCQGMWRLLAHEMPQHYVTPRESRRIMGCATVTYGGILAGETFPDVMVVCESNFDIKGLATSDILCCGVVWAWSYHVRYAAPIPYRALLPKGVENLLVAGRAHSASHDALALARMQRDMVSLGAAAGIAAALSVRTGTPPSRLNASVLQDEWVARGTLRREDRRRYAKSTGRYGLEDAERDVRNLLAGPGGMTRRLARLMRSPLSIGPLRGAFEAASKCAIKVKLARALCSLGDAGTVGFLLGVIAGQVKRGLPRPYRKTVSIPPEHGWAPEPAYSLYAIGLSGHGREAAAVMRTIAAKIDDNSGTFASKSDSTFEYVRAICAVAERNPGPEMIAPLETLLGKNCLRGLALRYDGDMRMALDPVNERCAYLELCLGRALARCGDRRGYDILLAYVDDVRGPLARSAVDELKDLLGETDSRERSAWLRLVEQRAASLAAKPFTRRIE